MALAKVAVGRYTQATGTLPVDGDTVTIGTTVYTWKNAVTTVAETVLIGGTSIECIFALANTVNDIRPPIDHGSLTAAHDDVRAWPTAIGTHPSMFVVANIGGAAGNGIATTELTTGGSWGGVFLAGGTDAT